MLIFMKQVSTRQFAEFYVNWILDQKSNYIIIAMVLYKPCYVHIQFRIELQCVDRWYSKQPAPFGM